MGWPIKISVYAAGAAINGFGELESHIDKQLNDLQLQASNRFVAATSELGGMSGATFRRIIDPKSRWPTEVLPDTNAGDPNVILDYVEWSHGVMPSQRLVMVLSGHGLSWQDEVAAQVLTGRTRSSLFGIPDFSALSIHPRNAFGRKYSQLPPSRALLLDGTDRDYLSNAELGACFSRIADHIGHPVDCLLLDACLMSSWEVLQELHGSVVAVVASIDEISAAGINYGSAVSAITRLMGKVTGQEFASLVAGSFIPSTSFDSCVAIDLQSKAWSSGIVKFRRICTLLNDWILESEHNRSLIKEALRNASNSIVKSRSGALADIHELFEQLIRVEALPSAAHSLLSELENELNEVILSKVVGDDYNGSFGLSIFSPSSEYVYSVNRHDYSRLQFPVYTGWGQVLYSVFER